MTPSRPRSRPRSTARPSSVRLRRGRSGVRVDRGLLGHGRVDVVVWQRLLCAVTTACRCRRRFANSSSVAMSRNGCRSLLNHSTDNIVRRRLRIPRSAASYNPPAPADAPQELEPAARQHFIHDRPRAARASSRDTTRPRSSTPAQLNDELVEPDTNNHEPRTVHVLDTIDNKPRLYQNYAPRHEVARRRRTSRAQPPSAVEASEHSTNASFGHTTTRSSRSASASCFERQKCFNDFSRVMLARSSPSALIRQ